MNHEQLIFWAGVAIAEFNRLHDTSCYLCIEGGTVRAYPKKQAKIKPTPCLVITTWQQQNGLTTAQWNSIGTALLNEFNVETARCQHQKHST